VSGSIVVTLGFIATLIFAAFCYYLGVMDYCVVVGGIEDCTSNFQKFLHSSPNEKGDTLAGLAGSLAFLWIIITVLLQSKELKLQRIELGETREEIKLTRQAYEVSNDHLARQRFESLFFELVATHNSIVNSIDLRSSTTGEIISNGRDCFKSFYKELDIPKEDRMYPEYAEDKADERYESLYKRHRSDLGHYFRFIYNAMRVISKSEYSDKTHRRLYRSLFSDDELLIIFYNARSVSGWKLKSYIEDFEFFNNLPRDRVIHSDHLAYFSAHSYGIIS
jgi:hypothetical protein